MREEPEHLLREFLAADERRAVEEVAGDGLAGEGGILLVALGEQIVRAPDEHDGERRGVGGRLRGEVTIRREGAGEDFFN